MGKQGFDVRRHVGCGSISRKRPRSTDVLAYDRMGAGVPLVFVHAFPLNRKMWESVKPTFAKNFQFISLDLPGFGESRLSSDTSTMEFMAQEIISTLNHLGIKEKFIASGVSMGGYVLFQLAKLFPDRLRALGFISTRSAADSPQTREGRFRTIDLIQKGGGLTALAEKIIPQLIGASSLKAGLPVVQEVRTSIEKENPDGVCAALRGMAARPDSTAFLSQIHAPTLVVSGDEDVFVPTAEMKALAEGIKGCEFQIVPKAGHLLTMEKPAEFTELFMKFLKRSVL